MTELPTAPVDEGSQCLVERAAAEGERPAVEAEGPATFALRSGPVVEGPATLFEGGGASEEAPAG